MTLPASDAASQIGPWAVSQIKAGTDTKAIRNAVMDGKKMKVLPVSEWNKFSWDEIRKLLHETATYVVPTEELLDLLDELIGDDKCIEICAGNGFIGSNLDIIMTDSYVQKTNKTYQEFYKRIGHKIPNYPKSVIKLEASDAVRRMKPTVVLGCYATHKWRDDTMSGNWWGVDFFDIWKQPYVKKLILVGNLVIHKDNPMLDFPHMEIKLDGLITNSSKPDANRVLVWEKAE